MTKNVVIALQSIIIVFGLLFGWQWAQIYQHRTEQLFYVNHLRIMAADIQLLSDLKKRIAEGNTEQVAVDISTHIDEIVEEMEEHIGERVDPEMTDTFATAKEAGATLDELGIHRVSAAVNSRAKSVGK
jgi:hypothetical protein